MFPDGCDNSQLGLRRARVESFCGLIFANWNEEAEDLKSYLGDFGWYVNSIFGRAKDGYEVLGPPQRFVVDANWKTAAEQFAGDGYHAGQLHRSLADLVEMDPNNPRQWALYDPKVSTDKGHGIICFNLKERLRRVAKDGGVDEMTPLERLQVIPPPGLMPEQVADMAELYSPEELRFLSENPPSNGGLFPNAGIWSNLAMLPNGGPSAFLSFRTFVPRGPNKFEFTMWVLVAKNATEEFRNKMRLTASFGQGATGFVESDDAEVWPGITRGARGYIGRQNKLRYWAQSGVNKPDDWPAGGDVHTGFSRDDNQWSWWSHYLKTLTAVE
jgi:phenylpropionate dioxygenase-like ring-hydroxylating dioxygenase large terminal subunit